MIINISLMNMDTAEAHIHTSMNMTWFHILLVAGSAITVTIVLNILFWIWRRRLRSRFTNTMESNLELSENLEDERNKSSIIIGSIEDGVVLINDNQTILLFNPGAEAITGWSAKEAIGIGWRSVFKLVDSKGNPYTEEMRPLTKIFRTGQSERDNQLTLLTRSGKQVALDLNLTPLKTKDGRVTGAVAVFRDISAERSAERQRAEFISTASHEMRTPVAAIEGYLALALNEKVSKLDASAKAYIMKAHAATQHLGELFQDLLTSAKAEDGRLSNHPVKLEIGELIRRLGEELKFSADKKGLGLRISIGATPSTRGGSLSKIIPPLYYAAVDPDRLREVITNLFDNAVKYTETGTITLGVTGNEDVVQLRVADTGRGIPPEDIPHLFQKFYRVDNTDTRTIGGTGLGLFICRKIISLYNGRIWVESKEGEGSTFYINLPRLKANNIESVPQSLPAQSASPAAIPTSVKS